jgi:putative zinc finger protein
MQHLDEGTIHAWIDGALSPEETRAAEAHVASCAECQAAVAEARGLIAAASRILTALDDVPGGVLPAGAASPGGQGSSIDSLAAFRQRRDRGRRRWWFTGTRVAAAAVIVLAAGTYTVMRARGGPASMLTAASDTASPVPATAPLVASEPAPQAASSPVAAGRAAGAPSNAPQPQPAGSREQYAAGGAQPADARRPERRVAAAETDESKDAAKKADVRERRAAGASPQLADRVAANVTAVPDSEARLQKTERDVAARADSAAARPRAGITPGQVVPAEAERIRGEVKTSLAVPAAPAPAAPAARQAGQPFAPRAASDAAAASTLAKAVSGAGASVAFAGCYDLAITMPASPAPFDRPNPFAGLPTRVALDTTVARTDSVGTHRRARSLDRAAQMELVDATWMPVQANAGPLRGDGIRLQLEPRGRVLSALLISRNGELRGTIGQILPPGSVVLGVPISARPSSCTPR